MVVLLSKFDPWRSGLCTCPPKLTFNPYSGCDHACVYCYASGYVMDFSNCRPKRNLLKMLQKEACKLDGEIVSIANSSDPYPHLETEKGLTRACLQVLSRQDCKLQIITKSPNVERDSDLLCKVPATVAMTITTEDEELARMLEPNAPSPNERVKTVEALVTKGIAVSVRIDPIVPFLNDNPAHLLATLAELGVKHITSSTYKVKRDNWQRFSAALPSVAEKLKPLYFEKGQKIGGSILLPKDLRYSLMENVREQVLSLGLSFGVCREGMSELNTAACDGSWLLNSG
jgi:DNA repair photolyase